MKLNKESLETLEEIADIIKNARTICISTHINPDGDAIGSSLGLAIVLDRMGKRVRIFNKDPIPRLYDFLAGKEFIKPADDDIYVDAHVILDCSEASRVGKRVIDRVHPRITINIDHHETSDGHGDINLILPEAAATSEIVFILLKRMGVAVPAEAAEALLTGIIMDTWSFQQTNTTSQVLRVAADLVDLGADPSKISMALFESHTESQLRLLARVLDTLEIRADGALAMVTVTERSLKETGTGAEDIEGFVNFPRSISGIKAAALIRETGGNRYKISLRSKNSLDVASIAAKFGGGGHKMAAGCEMKGTLEEVKEKIVKEVEESARRCQN